MSRKDWAIALLGFLLICCLTALPRVWAGLFDKGAVYIGDVPAQPWGPDELRPGR